MRFLFARISLVVLLAGGGLIAHAQAPNGARLLDGLQKGLAQARALPAGERPMPPEDDLSALIDTSRSKVLKALAAPSHCEPDESTDCARSNSWSYEWGPPTPEPESGDGYITVTTGGPWLLVIQFSNERVSAARWLGQR